MMKGAVYSSETMVPIWRHKSMASLLDDHCSQFISFQIAVLPVSSRSLFSVKSAGENRNTDLLQRAGIVAVRSAAMLQDVAGVCKVTPCVLRQTYRCFAEVCCFLLQGSSVRLGLFCRRTQQGPQVYWYLLPTQQGIQIYWYLLPN